MACTCNFWVCFMVVFLFTLMMLMAIWENVFKPLLLINWTMNQWFMTGPCNILDMDLAHLYCIYKNCYLMYLNCGNQTLWILMTCPKYSKTKAERFHVCFKPELWCCHCCCCWSNLLSSAQFWTCIVFCSAKI